MTSALVSDASVAQRESIAFTRRGSQVQSLPLAPSLSQAGGRGHPRVFFQKDSNLNKLFQSGIFSILAWGSVLEDAA